MEVDNMRNTRIDYNDDVEMNESKPTNTYNRPRRRHYGRRPSRPFNVEVEVDPIFGTLLMPEKKTTGSAGYDLKCSGEYTVHVGERVLIPTGVKFKIPYGNVGFITPRSSYGLKGITIPNSPGTIDSDYRDEIKVILENRGEEDLVLKPGDRIAQIVFLPIRIGTMSLVPKLSPDRYNDREGGFGSTGND